MDCQIALVLKSDKKSCEDLEEKNKIPHHFHTSFRYSIYTIYECKKYAVCTAESYTLHYSCFKKRLVSTHIVTRTAPLSHTVL